MQIQKEHTREQILQAAEQAFHQQGFAKTSMRDIARLSGVGVGNLYNYFPKGKDEIFRLIVSPLIQDMERMVYEHHDERHAERYLDYLSNGNPELLEYQMREYLSLMRRHRRLMERNCFSFGRKARRWRTSWTSLPTAARNKWYAS